MRTQSALPLTFLAFLCMFAVSALAENQVSGTVRNQTTGRPSSGDRVVLLRLDQGMEEEATATTDSQGAFSLDVPMPRALHIVRVFHQGVNYDQPVQGKAPVEIDVFDAVSSVDGLKGNIGIAKVESDGTTVTVMEMYSITNPSIPRLTQSGEHNFEIDLPDKGSLQTVEAKGPGNVWVKVSAAEAKGKKGKYLVNFPLRPGDTLFRFSYHLPVRRHTTFHLRMPYPIQNFAVMHPPSMQFKASHPADFASRGVVDGLQVEQAASQPLVGLAPVFEIAGTGKAPPNPSAAEARTPAGVSAKASANSHSQPVPAGQAGAQPRSEFWLMIVGIVALSGIAAFTFYRIRRRVSPLPRLQKGTSRPAAETMKEALFQLERERLRGRISAEEYTSAKNALTQNLGQILVRSRKNRAIG